MKKANLFAASGQLAWKTENISKLHGLGVEAVLDDYWLTIDHAFEHGAKKAEHWAKLCQCTTADWLWAVRGGSGSVHMLPFLEPLSLPKKVVVGFSDLTALLNYLVQHKGFIACHAPDVNGFLKSTASEQQAVLKRLNGNWHGELAAELAENLLVWRPGRAQAKLIGGNLTTIASLIGTPWQLQPKGCVCFLEDVHEPLYRIERLLAQLWYAGFFKHLNGLVFGEFLCQNSPIDSQKLQKVFQPYLEQLNIPVIAGFPAGHGLVNRPLPLGAVVELNTHPLSFKTIQFNPQSVQTTVNSNHSQFKIRQLNL